MKDLRRMGPSAAKLPRTNPGFDAAESAGQGMIGFADDGDFAAVFDSSAEALLVADTQGTILRANRRARELLRYKETGPRKVSLGEYFATPPTAQITEAFRHNGNAENSARVEAHLLSGSSVPITLRAILPKTRNLLLCLEEGSVVQRAEGKWRQVQSELESLLDSVETGVILYDPTGAARFINARFAQLFGLDVQQLHNLEGFDDLEALLAARFSTPEAFAAPWRSFAAGGGDPSHDELEMERPSRRVLRRFSRPVLDAEGRERGWLELYSDITAERQIKAKMLQTEKMAALGQLVSGIAHELNNPLTAIMGYAQLLLGHGLAAPQLSDVSKMYQEAERARRIVKNLLFFARENRPERTRVDLNEIVERTLALRSYELKVENISVECNLAQDLPETMADPHQLQQVVLNLLVNAEQAVLEGRGQGNILIRTRRLPGDRNSIEISDDGPGIPREIASRIFDPFFTTKPPGVGTGLGLSIVYGIVKQHEGEVTFENVPGAGARFTVELPVIAVSSLGQKGKDGPSAGEGGAMRPGHVLVVEDEPTVAQLIVDVLREEGHQADAVLDSQEGLTRLARASYDLVICDLRMPRLDGPAFYEALVRSGSPLRDHIVFITGDMLAARTRDFLEGHSFPYLAKPFLVEELKIAISRMLAQSFAENEPQRAAKAHSASTAATSRGSSVGSRSRPQ